MSKEKDECNQTVDFYEEEDSDGEDMDTQQPEKSEIRTDLPLYPSGQKYMKEIEYTTEPPKERKRIAAEDVVSEWTGKINS